MRLLLVIGVLSLLYVEAQYAIKSAFPCFLNNEGQVKCFKYDTLDFGNLTVIAFSYLYSHACALLSDGTVRCAGANDYGQLGRNNNISTSVPYRASSWASITAVPLGQTALDVTTGSYHSCALLSDRSVKCWGYSEHGATGQNTILNIGDKAGSMQALSAIYLGPPAVKCKSLSTGLYHNCCILDDNSLKCWGYNAHGEAGHSSPTYIGINVGDMQALSTVNLGTIGGLSYQVSAVSTGGFHTCVILLQDGKLKCFGGNFGPQSTLYAGQLGLGITDLSVGNLPYQMGDNLTTVKLGLVGEVAQSVSTGYYHTCVVLSGSFIVKCWGYGFTGMLGQNDNLNIGYVPGDVSVLAGIFLGAQRTARSVRAGLFQTCVIMDNFDMKCFGEVGAYFSRSDSIGDAPGEMQSLPTIHLWGTFAPTTSNPTPPTTTHPSQQPTTTSPSFSPTIVPTVSTAMIAGSIVGSTVSFAFIGFSLFIFGFKLLRRGKYVVFISYQEQEGGAIATAIFEYLKKRFSLFGLDFIAMEQVFMALAIGIPIDQIFNAVRQSEILLVVYSQRYLNSAPCLLELCLACQANIPITLVFTIPPNGINQLRDSLEDPNFVRGLIDQNGWRMLQDRGFNAEFVVAAIRKLLNNKAIAWHNVLLDQQQSKRNIWIEVRRLRHQRPQPLEAAIQARII